MIDGNGVIVDLLVVETVLAKLAAVVVGLVVVVVVDWFTISSILIWRGFIGRQPASAHRW